MWQNKILLCFYIIYRTAIYAVLKVQNCMLSFLVQGKEK